MGEDIWFSIINIVVGLLTAITAVIGIFLTREQMEINNKHHLFDKRTDNLLFIEELLITFKINYNIINRDSKEEVRITNDYDFKLLTNNVYLAQISSVVNEPLKEGDHKEFLYKLNDMKKESIKTKYLFSKEKGNILSEFIIKYKELLSLMYQYQILLGHINRENEKNIKYKLHKTLEELSEQFNEKEKRKELLEGLSVLNEIYFKIEENNVMELAERETSILKRKKKNVR